MSNYCIRFQDIFGKIKNRCIYNAVDENDAIAKFNADPRKDMASIIAVSPLKPIDIDEWHNADITNKTYMKGLIRRHE